MSSKTSFGIATYTLSALLLTQGGCSHDSTKKNTAPAVNYNFATNATTDYTRVDRMGMPAIATAVITSKDDYNRADPTDDVAGIFVSEITDNVNAIHTALDDDLIAAGLTPTADGVGQAAPLVIPDTLSITTTTTSGFPNGRRLTDPVMDITLAVVLVDLSVHPVTVLADLPLNPPSNDHAFLATFPYLAAPNVP